MSFEGFFLTWNEQSKDKALYIYSDIIFFPEKSLSVITVEPLLRSKIIFK